MQGPSFVSGQSRRCTTYSKHRGSKRVVGTPLLSQCFAVCLGATADGRNPAPPGRYKTLEIMRYLRYQLVQDFFHQQYVGLEGVCIFIYVCDIQLWCRSLTIESNLSSGLKPSLKSTACFVATRHPGRRFFGIFSVEYFILGSTRNSSNTKKITKLIWLNPLLGLSAMILVFDLLPSQIPKT